MIIEYLLWALLAIIIIIGVYFVMSSLLVYGQTPTTQGLQPLPQDYYVITQLPKGISVAAQEQPLGFNLSDIISGLVGGGAGALYAKFRGDKNQKTVQEVAQTQVKIAEVQQGTLEQVYENMPNKGNEITNKPVIKQENVEKIKDKAVETAAKA